VNVLVATTDAKGSTDTIVQWIRLHASGVIAIAYRARSFEPAGQGARRRCGDVSGSGGEGKGGMSDFQGPEGRLSLDAIDSKQTNDTKVPPIPSSNCLASTPLL
jgi:hypothetical protein